MLHPYAGSEEVQYVYVTLPKEVDVATVGPGTVIKLQVISAELQFQLCMSYATCSQCYRPCTDFQGSDVGIVHGDDGRGAG